MDSLANSTSHAMFGTRVDSVTPAQIAVVMWESVTSRRSMQVVLADVWTLLLAQREFAVWEALVAADYVLPVEDDAVMRRLTQRQHIPLVQPGLLLYDLCTAASQTQKHVTLLGPDDEVDADVALMQRIWPTLDISGTSRWSAVRPEPDDVVVRKLNEQSPDLLVIGGESLWQEVFVHARRDELYAKVIMLLPTLHTALAAVGQHAGIAAASLGRLRRKAALRRAIMTTIAPAASASAESVGAWIREAREGLSDLSAAIQAQRPPATLRRLQALRTPADRAVAVRVHEWSRTSSEILRQLNPSPPARLGSSRPALPAPAPAIAQPSITDELDADRSLADQPTVSLSLEALRGGIPPIITGEVVDSGSLHPTPQPEVAASLAPRVTAPLDPQQAADAAEAFVDVIYVGPLGPTTLLSGRAAAETAPADEGTPDVPPTDAGAPDAPPEPRVPVEEPLAPTRLLRRPTTTPPPADDAIPAATPTSGDTQPMDTVFTNDANEPQGTTPPVRIVRKYIVKRMRRKSPRRRQRRPHPLP
jgi:UDP-N-acetyl-D-mannosaminuronic acid transferase (WecB/TagA/CpsF family)